MGNDGQYRELASKWSNIYDQYFENLYHLGIKFCNHPYIVEDTIQDLFSDLIRLKKNPDEIENPKTYLYKSLRRRILKELDRQRKLTDKTGHIETQEFYVNYAIEKQLSEDETDNPNLERLAKALKKLSPRQKEAIYLRFECEMDYPEIAHILDVSIDTSRTLIYRAIKFLRIEVRKGQDNSIVLWHIISRFFRHNKHVFSNALQKQ